jgi:poly(hydroxyalkanoate) depolymerase family esterase
MDAAPSAQPRPARSGAPSTRLTEVTDFGSNPGALRMFTHVPAHAEPAPALVVVLHGCTQSAASYDEGAGWSTLANRYGFALLLPQQQASNNPKACFNWFQPGDIARDRGEALSIRQMVATMIADHGIDRSRVFVTGLSAGGAMTSVMLATYPDVFAAGAIIAGLPYGTATNVQRAFESMFQGRPRPAREWGDLVRRASPHRGPWPRVSVWHGDADATVKSANADDIVRQWTNVHGLETAPTECVVDGYRRQVWRAAGEDVIESYTITGMAHGTPLATGSSDRQCGTAGPFLLEVGISSSHHIATFFGLTGTAHAAATETRASAVGEHERASIVPDDGVEIIPDERVEILGPEAGTQAGSAEPGRPGPLDISAIITKALTSAGLMKPPA